MTVALSMAAMVLFPMYFLKSFAYAGVAVVAFAALAAVVVAPAAIVLLGARLDALDVRRLGRRLLGRPEPRPDRSRETFWYRSHKVSHATLDTDRARNRPRCCCSGRTIPRRPMGLPRRPGTAATASSRQVGDEMRDKFADDSATNVTVVLPDAAGLDP